MIPEMKATELEILLILNCRMRNLHIDHNDIGFVHRSVLCTINA